jgi:hypothetical protein
VMVRYTGWRYSRGITGGGVALCQRFVASGLVAVGVCWGELADVGDIGGWH